MGRGWGEGACKCRVGISVLTPESLNPYSPVQSKEGVDYVGASEFSLLTYFTFYGVLQTLSLKPKTQISPCPYHNALYVV